MKRPRGFTLIEIAIAIAVLAVLSALALPGFGASLERQRLHAAAQQLAADLTEARFEAARRGLPLHLRATIGAQWCWAVTTTPDCTCGTPQPSCQLRNVRAADLPGVRLATAHDVALDPNGSATAADGTTLESRRGDRLRVSVGPSGRARICAAAGHWPQLPAC